jgi:tRNA(Ile)-lysidine synthase TilS/MesJ
VLLELMGMKWFLQKKRILIAFFSFGRYNVVAMGQHLDDMCESFMMSFWLNGKLRTQKACYVVDEGDLRFIRPFAYVRERDLK